MNPTDYRVRRATVEDLGALKAMWAAMRFSPEELERRLTEFQVVEGPGGKVVGGWGFQMEAKQGHIHSEAFSDFAVADIARPLFWNRLQSLTANHGIFRLWTQENTPYWTHNGFQPARPETLEKLPESWNRSAPGWLTLQLKDEEAIASLEKEFALFKEAEQQQTARALSQAKTLKNVVTLVAIGIAILLFAVAAWLFFKRQTGSLPPAP